MKLCDTCIYRNNVEQLKPCIIYRDNCEYYEKEMGDMTKEQSIKWLKDMLKNFDLPQEQYQTALEMAIQALEQESCGDTISRQAVFDLVRSLTRWCVRSEDGKFNNVGLLYDDVMFGIYKLPPVNPQEPKTGHWIEVTNSRGGHECDVCHDYAPSFQSGDEYLSAFCPKCGAKMQEVEE